MRIGGMLMAMAMILTPAYIHKEYPKSPWRIPNNLVLLHVSQTLHECLIRFWLASAPLNANRFGVPFGSVS